MRNRAKDEALEAAGQLRVYQQICGFAVAVAVDDPTKLEVTPVGGLTVRWSAKEAQASLSGAIAGYRAAVERELEHLKGDDR